MVFGTGSIQRLVFVCVGWGSVVIGSLAQYGKVRAGEIGGQFKHFVRQRRYRRYDIGHNEPDPDAKSGGARQAGNSEPAFQPSNVVGL